MHIPLNPALHWFEWWKLLLYTPNILSNGPRICMATFNNSTVTNPRTIHVHKTTILWVQIKKLSASCNNGFMVGIGVNDKGHEVQLLITYNCIPCTSAHHTYSYLYHTKYALLMVSFVLFLCYIVDARPSVKTMWSSVHLLLIAFWMFWVFAQF